MSRPPRRSKIWGSLAFLIALTSLVAVYFFGVLPVQNTKKSQNPLCWVSPINPHYIKKAPGKDPEGRDLVPVYPTPPGEKPSGPAVAAAPAAKTEPQAKAYHCPMHPEVVSSAPGKCPKCGMDLTPVTVAPSAPARAVPAPAAKKERQIKYWVSPMDPGYVRDKPGKAPCGMDLVPVYEDEAGDAAGGKTIAVSPTTVQSMGVRTAKVEVRPLSHDTWAVGLVTFNERNLSVVNAKVSGWVERLYVNATGDPVRQGQALLSIYSPDLVSAQEEYLLALRNLKTLEKSPYPELVDGARRLLEASRRRLEYFDISTAQIEELKNTGRVKKQLVLASPARGIVTKRLVTQGQMVQAGMPLLEVADLSTIWVDTRSGL